MNQPRPLERIVLASASPRRLDLLRSLALHVETVVSGYEEPPLPGRRPRDVAVAHANEKLSAVIALPRCSGIPVVAADTVVDVDGCALGKPAGAPEAREMLARLSGRSHLVHTAFALAVPPKGGLRAECVTTEVRFYPLSGEEIAAYVAGGDPLDKAGGYGIQGAGAALVERIDGDFYTVMGLPLGRLIRALRQLGFSLPATKPTGS